MSVLIGIALVIIAVLLFELIIFIHEFGHFITAKKSGVQVNEFALGMGPKLFSFTKGETTYSFRLFPIGGFCSMEAEDEESENPRAFTNAKIWKRMIIIVAGAVMNILLGFVLMFVVVIQSPAFASTTIEDFYPNSFTANCGLKIGDKIIRMNDYKIVNSKDFAFALATMDCKEYDGSSLQIYKQDCTGELCNLYSKLYQKKIITDKNSDEVFKILTKGTGEINVSDTKNEAYEILCDYYDKIQSAVNSNEYVVPEIKVEKKRLRFRTDITVIRNGKTLQLTDVDFLTYKTSKDAENPTVAMDFYVESIDKNFMTVLQQTGEQTISTVKMVWFSLIGLLSGEFSVNEVSGPVGVASAMTEVASQGLETGGFLNAVNNIINFMMFITVNLGIFNMLPFPALDGGRFLFLLIEGIFRKPVPRKFEYAINAAGLVLLLLLSLIITLKDIWKLLPF